jgi:serine phosphatase RsbU (regulator of sigma subunit)
MEIVPFYGQSPLSVSNVFVRVNPEDQKRAEELVVFTSSIRSVDDQPSFNRAKAAAGQLKAMLNEIENGKKSSKATFTAINNAIGEQARLVGDPVDQELRRVLDLLNGYVGRLEAKAKEEEARARAIAQAQQQEALRRIAEAQDAQRRAEEAARAAKDEASRERARADAKAKELALAQAELAREMELEIAGIGADRNKRSLVSGGRVDHPYTFKLVSLRETLNAGCVNLLRWELDVRACQDSVRAQLQIDPEREPSLPGIEITKKINVSVKASARVL